jgi:hypothetical protein
MTKALWCVGCALLLDPGGLTVHIQDHVADGLSPYPPLYVVTIDGDGLPK